MKKVENHPHRQALQDDLQQNNAYYPFSEKSKKMIRDMGNVELFEFCETSYIHHTCEYKQYCHVGNTAKTMQVGTVSRFRFCGRS